MSELGLTNIELMDLAKENDIQLDNVIMMDEVLKLNKNKNHNLIVNLQNTGQGGSHWVCLIIRGKKWLYIDSFGGCPHPIIIKQCLKNKYQLGYSAYICQDLKSQRCGYYSLQSIKHLQNSDEKDLFDNANTYVNKYEPNRLENEKILMKMFRKKRK